MALTEWRVVFEDRRPGYRWVKRALYPANRLLADARLQDLKEMQRLDPGTLRRLRLECRVIPPWRAMKQEGGTP
jgi:hypothetical protein